MVDGFIVSAFIPYQRLLLVSFSVTSFQALALPCTSAPTDTFTAEESLHRAVTSTQSQLVTVRQLTTALSSTNLLSSIQSSATSACVIIAQRLSLLLQLLSHDRLQSLLMTERRRWGSAAGRANTEGEGEGEGLTGEGGGMRDGGGDDGRGGQRGVKDGREGADKAVGREEGGGREGQAGYALQWAEELRKVSECLDVDTSMAVLQDLRVTHPV